MDAGSRLACPTSRQAQAQAAKAGSVEKQKEIRVSDFYDPYKKLDARALTALTSDFSKAKEAKSTSAQVTPETSSTTENADTPPAESGLQSAKTENDLEQLGVIRLQGITKAEAKAILEYWAMSGMVRRQIGEDFVAEKWTVSGGGVLKEMERGVLRRTV